MENWRILLFGIMEEYKSIKSTRWLSTQFFVLKKGSSITHGCQLCAGIRILHAEALCCCHMMSAILIATSRVRAHVWQTNGFLTGEQCYPGAVHDLNLYACTYFVGAELLVS